MPHNHQPLQHPQSSESPAEKNNKQSRYRETRKVTLVGAAVNIFLSLAQLFGGIVTQSQALIADGAHTLSDLASDMVVLVAAKLASKEADEEHPYGHGRIETVATIILGILLSTVAVGIALDALGRLSHPELLLNPKPTGLLFALLAIVSKEILFQYTKRTAKLINSPMLLANAWHHRSDAISSLVVLAGIGGAVFLHIRWLDAVAAIIVAGMILYMALQMIKDSILELVDTALEPERVQEIHRFIEKIDGVKSLHMLRTRQMGGSALADVHVQVNSHISVSEGHHIAERVMNQLMSEFPELQDVTVHIDPEDDESVSPSKHLPSREEILQKLCPELHELGLTEDDTITLHYLDGKISLFIHLASHDLADKTEYIKQVCDNHDDIDSVSVYTKQA